MNINVHEYGHMNINFGGYKRSVNSCFFLKQTKADALVISVF